MRIDLNADLGEGYGAYVLGEDARLLDVVSSANVACGFHAGDPHTMRATVEACLKRGVAIGAHPGLPDRLGFGRREMAISAREAADFVLYQIGALQGFVGAAGGKLSHVKLHGALYHMAGRDEKLAEAIANAVREFDPRLLVYGLPGSRLEIAARSSGIGFVPEGFADRAYAPDGRLVPRGEPGAVLGDADSVVRQALRLARENRFRTICVHGDTPEAAESAERIAERLRGEGISIRAPENADSKGVE